MKNLTAVIALLAVFTLAICFILIGSISEEIKVVLGIDDSQLGTLASTLFLTCLAVQLFIGVLVDKFGHKVLALAGFFITSGAIFLLAFAGSFALALGACALLGVGAMCVNMVVFGLGRGPGTRPLFRGPGQRISVGFVESSQPLQAHEQVARAVTDAIAGRAPAQAEPISLSLWYGRQQQFGHLGEPQRWVNLLGNVTPFGQVASLTHSLIAGGQFAEFAVDERQEVRGSIGLTVSGREEEACGIARADLPFALEIDPDQDQARKAMRLAQPGPLL